MANISANLYDNSTASDMSSNQTFKFSMMPGYHILLAEKSRLRTGIVVSYLATMIVGLIGNSLVIYVIGRNSQIRNKSVANYYIWNLAFADLMFILTMPFFCYSTYYNEWPFGVTLCKMASAFSETMRYTSMFTLVALSFDRYLASFFNLTHLRTIKVGVAVCIVIWIICGTIAIPYAMHATVLGKQCTKRQSTQVMTFMTYFQLASALIIPFTLICLSYILLALRLKKIMMASAVSVQRPNRKMTTTVLVVVITFLIWQTPYHVNNVINLQKHLTISQGSRSFNLHAMLVSMYLNTVSTILVFISSCCNPIIYGILNDNYRSLYISALCCCCAEQFREHRRASSVSVHDTTYGCRCLCLGNKHSEDRIKSHTVNASLTEHVPLGEDNEEEDEI